MRNEPRQALPVAEELMTKGGHEERECQKLSSVIAVGASELVSRNQLI